ncbi:unnamed protein product [Owenia fusiformis]|uniref:Innexin n=1 Tax=Owenia fusiformis TaxID=6347 RepID=A0A8J1THR3_OWEFU|nr:unnamed protein product [Owenia fusiformis]
MEYIKGLSQIGRGLKTCDDIFLRINYLYTPIFLIGTALYVTIAINFGEKIRCWTPAHFTHAHVDYTNAKCWHSNTYYTPFVQRIPMEMDLQRVTIEAKHRHVALYFVYMAGCFFAPIILWWAVTGKSGLDVDAVIKDGSKQNIQTFVDKFGEYMKKAKSNPVVKLCAYCTTFYGTYLVLVFAAVKLIYVINVIVQLHRVDEYLADNINVNGTMIKIRGSYAAHVLVDLSTWQGWTSGHQTFPDEILCDYRIRKLGNVERYTSQCILLLNEMNRNIFRVVWIWLCVLILVNIYSFLSWIIATCRGHMTSIVSRGLMASQPGGADNAFLMKDGAFLLGLIDQNADKGVAASVIEALLKQQKAEDAPPENIGGHPPRPQSVGIQRLPEEQHGPNYEAYGAYGEAAPLYTALDKDTKL